MKEVCIYFASCKTAYEDNRLSFILSTLEGFHILRRHAVNRSAGDTNLFFQIPSTLDCSFSPEAQSNREYNVKLILRG